MQLVDQRNVNAVLNTGYVVMPPTEEFQDGDDAYLFHYLRSNQVISVVAKYGYLSVNQRKAVHYGCDNGYRVCGTSSGLTTNQAHDDQDSEACSTCAVFECDKIKVRYWNENLRQPDTVPFIADGVFSKFGVVALDQSARQISDHCEGVVNSKTFKRCSAGFRNTTSAPSNSPLSIITNATSQDDLFRTFVFEEARGVGVTVSSVDAFVVSSRKKGAIVPIKSNYVWLSFRTHTGIYSLPCTPKHVSKAVRSGFTVSDTIHRIARELERAKSLSEPIFNIASNLAYVRRKTKKPTLIKGRTNKKAKRKKKK